MKDLIQKLNTLKEVKPSASWKKNNRRILLAQISTGEEKAIPTGFFSIIHQPAWAVFCIFLLVVAGGGISTQAAKNIKPGDSLFIARVISEKAQLAMTFNKEKRVKLDMQLAKNRAEEITEIMADPNFDHKNEKKIQKLAQNFKNDINTVKTRLQEMNKANLPIEEDKIVGLGGISREEGKVFSVESSRNDSGINFEESNFKLEQTTEEIPVVQALETIEETIKTETSTEEMLLPATIATTTEENINNIIEKAEEAFEEGNFEETRDILEEVEDIINDIENDEGQVKGVEEGVFNIGESSTSTD